MKAAPRGITIDAPISVYEVHLGSWRRAPGNRMLSYLELAEQLVDYVADMGFTHIECLPVSEFPFDGSWGYQPVGMFAPTIRHGTPSEFRAFVDAAHRKGLGVILDWVPGHFPTDPHGLGRFDGTSLYEHQDPREGFHQDWNTLIYNYGRVEVKNYLVSPTPCIGWRNTTSTGCGWMRSRRCCTATIPARMASGSRTRTAGARITRRSPCCATDEHHRLWRGAGDHDGGRGDRPPFRACRGLSITGAGLGSGSSGTWAG
jgi:hypothetical protein